LLRARDEKWNMYIDHPLAHPPNVSIWFSNGSREKEKKTPVSAKERNGAANFLIISASEASD